jgi:hypothetical protein
MASPHTSGHIMHNEIYLKSYFSIIYPETHRSAPAAVLIPRTTRLKTVEIAMYRHQAHQERQTSTRVPANNVKAAFSRATSTFPH